jgi:carboxymethylenebutenolidase
METFICHPERGGPFPAVFLLMDAPGIREELRDMARRLATIGYYVLLPNLYYRAGRDTIYGPDVLEEGSADRGAPSRAHCRGRFLYGTWLVSDAEESPHRSFGKVKGELYIACAEHDNLAPLPMVEQLRMLFRSSGAAGEIELYPGVHHGFAFPQRWCYDKPAAERHWERLISLYRWRLG